jgi:uncharacterized protein YbaR (Trm112 family)
MSDTGASVPQTPVPQTPVPEVDVDPRLLEVLEFDRAKGELVSRGAKLAYPIRDGVPIMLPEEARELAEGE